MNDIVGKVTGMLRIQEFSECCFSPAVIGQITSFEKLRVFFFAGEIIVEIAFDFLCHDSSLAVNGFENIGYTVFFESVLQAERNFSVS